MAKINKLALARMALRSTINELDQRELLCVLCDLYTGTAEQPRWYGNGGGVGGLEQGIYNHMTTFRRVSNLWLKIKALNSNDEVKIKQEIVLVKDYVLQRLDKKGVDLTEIRAEEPNE